MTESAGDDLEFFIDRSLGRSIAAGLRKAGLTVHTMAEVYGEDAAQRLPDEVWLRDAGGQNWAIFTKDDAIRRRPAERDALIAASARVFCLTSAQLRAIDQLNRFIANRDRILRQAGRPGPYIYGVYKHRLQRLWPPAR